MKIQNTDIQRYGFGDIPLVPKNNMKEKKNKTSTLKFLPALAQRKLFTAAFKIKTSFRFDMLEPFR